MTFSGVYAIVIGTLMVIQWTVTILKKQVAGPETGSTGRGRVEMAFHWTAEAITAVLLIVSGIGMLLESDWGLAMFLVGIGMLIYTAVNSPGYFAQQRKWSMGTLFVVILAFTVVSLLLALK